MIAEDVARRGIVLVGCGRMGTALLRGWIGAGLAPGHVWVLEPNPGDWLRSSGVRLGESLPESPAIIVLAIKPQLMAAALPSVAGFGGGPTLYLSIAAGTTLSAIEAAPGTGTPVVRAMPNTPAAIGQGISAIVGNASAGPEHLDLAETLMRAVGTVVRLDDESQMDAVTAVSGSGPAYVFHLIETLAAAGEAEGLPAEMALALARATVAGAGALAMEGGESPAHLREAVTSPNGTTQAGLEVLMPGEGGLGPLVRRTVAAAAARSRELARD